MTDRELLEMAAKAAGIDIYFDEDGDCYRVKASGNRHYWHPLSYDGDALRLAVKLRIKFRYNEALGQALAWTGGVPDFEAHASIEDFGRDEVAATRRAIVRAAAEIGKAIP